MPQIIPDPTSGWWQALLAALSGGVLTKVLDRHFGNRQRMQDRMADMEARLREELRKDKEQLQSEISVLRRELDDWKQKYFDLLRKYGESEVARQGLAQALREAEEERAELARRKGGS